MAPAMKWTVVAMLVLLLAACAPKPPPPEHATVLYLEENDGAGATTPIRTLVTPKFVRIDGGDNAQDFLLYDRATRTIYDVTFAERLILVIAPRAGARTKPPKLYDRTKRDTAAMPAVGGKSIVHYQLLTNGRLCYDLYAADGLLPDAVIALREYREALAGEQMAAIGFTPSEQKLPCDLANHVYTPARHLAYGFPVRLIEFDARDPKRQRVTELKDYRISVEVAPELFQLPAGFRTMSVKDVQKGIAR
jgi:hypothetical protein